jgi:hypothetical protein
MADWSAAATSLIVGSLPCFGGIVDSFCIHNKVPSAAEIAFLYNSDNGFAQTGEAATAAETVTTKITDEIVEADEYVDTTTTPWQLVRHKKGDATTEYSRKNIKTYADADVISETQIPGRLTEPE